jgi:hypothetical protein
MGIPKTTIIWIGVWVLATLLILDAAFAAPGTGVATTVTAGTRQIFHENVPEARQGAVSAALELAVVNAFSRMVSPRVFAANLQFLYSRVLPVAQDYVVTYRVLGEIAHKEQYLVGVESKINLGLLEQTLTDAKILNSSTDKPMILFLIAEKTPKDLLPRYWWGNNPEPYKSHAEATIVKIMAQNRFKIAGMEQERPEPGFYDIRFNTIYDEAAAMDLAERLTADLVVIGRANAAESSNRMGEEKIYDAVIRLSAYDPASGQKILTCENQAAAKDGPKEQGDIQAIIRAAELAAAELTDKLDRFWTENLRKETLFDVQIEGKGFLPRFVALKKRFNEISEIENIQPTEIGSDRAVMEVTYKGSPAHFTDNIMLKTFEGFGIEITEVTDTLVKIRFIDDNNMLQTDDPGVQEENKTSE